MIHHFGLAIRFALLNLLRNRRRSLLSILIIAIAVFALTSAGGFGLYTYESLQQATARDIGHLTLSHADYLNQEESLPLEKGVQQATQVSRLLSNDQRIRGVQPRIDFTGLVSNGMKSTIFVGIGVNQREFDMKGPFLDIKQGKTLSDVRSPRYVAEAPELMLGVDLAKNLNVEVGDWLTLLATTSDGVLNAYDFKVQGVFSTGVPELDKRQLYIHIDLAQSLLSSDKVSSLAIFLFDTPHTGLMQAWVEQQLAQADLDQNLVVTPWQERAFFYEKVKSLYDRIFLIMGFVLGLVVFVALFNTMTMSVSERTREIGTLSALGAYPNDIVKGFMCEASLLALFGALMGGTLTGITALGLHGLDLQMPPPPGRVNGYPLVIYFSLKLQFVGTVAVWGICVTAAYLSARKGVSKPITEALSYV